MGKKKLEADAADLGLALEHAIAGNAETQSTIKKYQLQVRDAQGKVDAESRPSLLLLMPTSLLTGRLLPCRTLWRRAALFLRLLTDRDALLSRSWLTPTRTSLS